MDDRNLFKRMAPLLVLEILKKHTSPEEGGGLGVIEITRLLKSEYGLTIERKAVSRILEDLRQISEYSDYAPSWRLPMPFSIKHRTRPRHTGAIAYDWRICQEFEDWELRLITDGLLSLRSYQPDELLKKLHSLGSKDYQSSVQYTKVMGSKQLINKQFKLSIAAIAEAIRTGRRISFHIGDFTAEKSIHPRVDAQEKPMLFVVSPYQMAFRNGIYYLIGRCDGSDVFSHFRVDRLLQVQILGEPTDGYCTMDLRKYLDQNIDLCDGTITPVAFRIPQKMVGDVLDLFGEGIRLSACGDGTVVVRGEVNHRAMLHFAKAFAPDVKLLSPAALVDALKDDLSRAIL